MFDGSFLDYILWFPTIYVGFSIGEWFIHRHAMHEPVYKFFKPLVTILNTALIYQMGQMSGRHVTHHQLTNNDDMTINYYKFPSNPEKVKKKEMLLEVEFRGKNAMEEFQNLFFLWPTTVIISIPHFILVTIINFYIFKCSYLYVYLLDVLFIVVHSAMLSHFFFFFCL